MSRRFLLSLTLFGLALSWCPPSLQAVELSSNIDQLSSGNSLSSGDASSCTTDEDCNDQNPCTQEVCLIGGPQNDHPQGICIAALNSTPECEGDELPNTPPVCEEFPGQRCCRFHPDCDDGNPITNDICVNRESELGYCSNTPSVEECDDQNPCTRDERISSTACSFIPIEGCGVPETQATPPAPVVVEPAPPVAAPEEAPAPAITTGPEYIFGSGCSLGSSGLNLWSFWALFSPSLAFWILRKQK